MMHVRWSESNLEHTGVHGVTPDEIESIIFNASAPFPRFVGDGKWQVWGRGSGGRFLQVVYVVDDDGETAYPIHARPLTDKEKKRLRKKE